MGTSHHRLGPMRARSIHTGRANCGRKYPTDTNLGKLMAYLDMTKKELAFESDVNERTLTEYLAGRQKISPDHRARIARALDIDPRLLGPE